MKYFNHITPLLKSIKRPAVGKLQIAAVMMCAGALLLLGGGWVLVSQLRSFSGQTISLPVASAAPAKAPVTQKPVIKGNPVKIDIPSLDISLAIAPGQYNQDTKTWNVSTDKAHYANITPQPNDAAGNTFIYGHYRSNIFASLHKIKAGDTAIVTTDNGHVFYYQLIASKVVEPADTAEVFQYQGKPILTVQTCTGFMYSKRQLFTFDLLRVV